MSIARSFRRPRACFSNLSASGPIRSTVTAHHQRTPQTQWQLHGGLVIQKGGTDSTQNSQSFEDLFIQSLVLAGSCSQHKSAGHVNRHGGYRDMRCNGQIRHEQRATSRRSFSTNTTPRQSTAPAKPEDADSQPDPVYRPISKKEFGSLVNTYGEPPQLSKSNPDMLPLAPRLMFSAEEEERERRHRASPWLVPPQDAEHAQQLNHFQKLLSRLLGRGNLEELWQSFEELRSPRLRYLDYGQIRRLFRHMSWVSNRHIPTIKPRYFALLRECLGEKIPVTKAEWNSGIVYAGWAQYPTAKDLQNAAELWQQMEQNDVEGDSVTFAILFNTAIKAGCYALADSIYQDVIDRGLPLDRYFRTTIIYYAGLRASGDDVRQAFRDLVGAGEIIDTVVMNCVIAALIRAGEPAAAESVFAKMKQLHHDKLGVEAHVDWQSRKHSGRQLRYAAAILQEQREEHERSFFGGVFSSDEDRERVQRRSPIGPDSKTYRILIEHFAITAGQLPPALNLIAEMKERDLKVPGAAYVALFRGFARHGGVFHNDWNRENLDAIWNDFARESQLHIIDQPDSLMSRDDFETETRVVDEDADESVLRSVDESSNESEIQSSKEDTEKSAIESVDDNTEALSDVERLPIQPADAVYFTSPTAGHLLRAYYECAGCKRMQQVWREVQDCWPDMDERVRVNLQTYVDRLEARESLYVD